MASEMSVRAHIDDPCADTPVDPLCFFIRGWLWLGDAQSQIAVVEAWADGILLGATAALIDRPDVRAALSLPDTARNGYELFAHHPAAKPGGESQMEIRARLHDGSRIAPVFTRAIPTIGRDYRTNHFGVLLAQQTT